MWSANPRQDHHNWQYAKDLSEMSNQQLSSKADSETDQCEAPPSPRGLATLVVVVVPSTCHIPTFFGIWPGVTVAGWPQGAHCVWEGTPSPV